MKIALNSNVYRGLGRSRRGAIWCVVTALLTVALGSAPAGAGAGDAAEQGRAEEVRRAQDKLREDLLEREKQASAAWEEHAKRSGELAKMAQDGPPEGVSEGELFDRIGEELRAMRPDFEAALRDVKWRAAAPRYTPGDPGLSARAEQGDPEAQKLTELALSLAEGASTIEREAGEAATARLSGALRAEEELTGARMLALGRLPEPKRAEILGVDRPGIAELRWELWHIGARSRAHWIRRDSLRREAREALRDPFLLVPLLTRTALVLLVLVAVVYALRRKNRVLDAVATAIKGRVKKPRGVQIVDRARAAISALSSGVVFLTAIWGFHRALGPDVARIRGVELAYTLLLGYALYRLALTAAHGLIAWRSGSPGAPISAATSGKILRSLRQVGRYALATGFLLAVADFTLGEGYLYHAVEHLTWLGAIPLGLRLIRAWRDDIADAYLRLRPEGALASAVRKTRKRWYGFFIAVAAFLAIVIFAGGRALRRFVLGFDQSHRVLAFIFRKRIERRADAAREVAAADRLPEDLCARFSEEALGGPAEGIDHYPGLDRFEAEITAWKAGRRIGAAVVVGGVGSGKTSWLAAAEAKASGLSALHLALPQRLLTTAELVEVFATALSAPPEARAGVGALASWIEASPRLLIVMDDLEHLFLRGVDSWDAWSAFVELVERSGHGAFWLCAVAQHPYRYMRFVRGGAAPFRVIVELPPWPGEKLAELLRARTGASGYEVSYDDLLLDEEADADREARLLRTEHDFMRLLWDYAQGCPRVAIHFWLSSLVAGDGNGNGNGNGQRLKVRLFQGPRGDDLEVLNEVERFVLASAVWHDSITALEASRSLRFVIFPCQAALAKLVELGVLAADGGRHRVTTRWQRAVNDYLLRKHLIQP